MSYRFWGRTWPLFYCILILFLAVACSKSAEPPPLSSPIPMPEVEACRNSNLTFANVTPRSARDLINCLSGSRRVLKPYEEFLNSVPDVELTTLLAVYNKYVYAPIDVGPQGHRGRRVNKLLTLLDRMRADGVLQDFYKHFGHLAKNGVLQAGLPIAGRLFGLPQTFSEKEKRASAEAVKLMRMYMVDLINRNQLEPLLLAGDRILNSDVARAMAYLAGAPAESGQWSSDQFVDSVDDVLVSAIDSGDLKSIFVYLSDFGILKAPAKMSVNQVQALAGLVNYLAKDVNGNAGGQINRFVEAIKYSDQKLVCYNGSRVVPNILDMIMEENSKISPVDQKNFFLVKLPLLLGLTAETCGYPPRFVQSAQILFEMAVQGYSQELSAGVEFLRTSDRKEVLKGALSSKVFSQLGPSVEQIERRHLVGLFLKLIRENVGADDFELISKVLRQWSVENVSRDQLDRYLSAQKISLKAIAAKLPGASMVQDLYSLEDLLAGNSTHSRFAANWYRQLKDQQARVDRSSVGGNSIFDRVAPFYKRAFQDLRPNLKSFAQAMAREFFDTESGIGPFLHVAAIGSQYSNESPMQNVIKEVLEDDELIQDLAPIIWKLANDQKFIEAVTFTGQMALDGRLDVIIQFFQQALKAANDNSIGLTNFRPTAFAPMQLPTLLVSDAAKAPLHIAAVDMAVIDCPKISENFFSTKGFGRFLKCYGAIQDDRVVLKTESVLQSKGLLGVAADLIKGLFASKWTTQALTELEGLFRSGSLAKLNRAVESLLRESVDTVPQINRLLKSLSVQNGSEQYLLAVGHSLSMPNRQKAWDLLLTGVQAGPKWIWKGHNDARLEFHETALLYSTIKKMHAHWTDDQVKAYGSKLVQEFESRSDDWYFNDGVLPRLDGPQKRDVLLQFIKRLLYTGAFVRGECNNDDCKRSLGLEGFMRSLRKISYLDRQGPQPHLKASSFLRWGYKTERIEKWYRGIEDEPVLRVMNALDQLDLELRVANVKIASVENAGIKFKNDVYKSDDLPAALNSLKLLLRVGVAAVAVDNNFRSNPDAIARTKFSLNSARNMLNNFYVLDETAKNGYMLIMKELVKAFYESTPQQFRDSLDVENNDLANMDRLGDLGFFTYLGEAAARLDKLDCETSPEVHGNCLDVVVRSVLGLVDKVPSADVAKLRTILENMLSMTPTGVAVGPRDQKAESLLAYTLDRLLQRSADYDGRLQLKNVSFAFALASGKSSTSLSIILGAGELLSHSPKLMKWTIDFVLDQFFDDQSLLSRLASTVIHSSEGDFEVLQSYLDKAVVKNPYLVDATASLVGVAKEMDEDKFVSLLDGLKSNIESPEFKKLLVSESLKKANAAYLGSTGLVALLSENLEQPNKRKSLLGITQSLAGAELWSPLVDKYFEWSRSGDLDHSLNFIFENLQNSSTLVH